MSAAGSGAVVSPPGAAPTVQAFFEGIRAGRLVVQRCSGCGTLAVPPRAACGACGASAWESRPLSGEGAITSFTVIRVPPARLAAEAPYAIGVVRMSEGVSLLGRLVGTPVDDVRVGLPVAFVPPPTGDGTGPPVLMFRVTEPA